MLSFALLVGCSVSKQGEPTTSDDATEQSAQEDGSDGSGRSEFTPSEDNKDPSKNIDGVVVTEYKASHANPGQRVAYKKAPPDGGRHDPVWANCNGAVYEEPVRDEHMVHALEHGAVWIAYDPTRIEGADLDALRDRVDQQPFMMLSPYPGMDEPISVQSWGHQLALSDPKDKRIDQFITALRENEYTSPEPGARCDSDNTGFDMTNPPPLATTPPGPDAAPVDGS